MKFGTHAEFPPNSGAENDPKILCGHLGGEGNVGCTKVDVKKILGKARQRKMLYGEETAINEYFREKQKYNPSYFVEVEIDSEEKMTNIFWTEQRMQDDYACFGDSITFDITYRTNRHYRPLGSRTQTEGEPVYLVYKHDGNAQLDDRLVRARPQEGAVLCECKWWGTMGILCRHALTVQEALKFYEAVKPPNETPEPVPDSQQEAAKNRVVGTGGGIASKFPKKPKPSKNSKRQKAISKISRMRQRTKYTNLRTKEAAEATGREHDLAQIFNNDAIHAFTAFVQSQESHNIVKTAI
ncbi:Protein FAR1-RELATED SEQUENCE 5 [Linum grandiflorum]